MGKAFSSSSSASSARVMSKLEEDFATVREKVVTIMSSGDLRKAFEVAISWDAQSGDSSPPLLEIALASYGGDPEQHVGLFEASLQVSLLSSLLHMCSSCPSSLDTIERSLE